MGQYVGVGRVGKDIVRVFVGESQERAGISGSVSGRRGLVEELGDFFSCPIFHLASLYHGLTVDRPRLAPTFISFFFSFHFPVWIFMDCISDTATAERGNVRISCLLGFPGLSGGFIYCAPVWSLVGLGWQSIQDSGAGHACKALLCLLVSTSRNGSVGSVRFGSFSGADGSRCFDESNLLSV